MTVGDPPSPSFRSIFAGIAVVIILLLGIMFLGNIVKYVGATLAFIPSKLGLIHVVTREEIIPIDFSISPTSFTVKQAGQYMLYTDNYDLLVINDAIVAAGAKPWFRLESLQNNAQEFNITLIERGLTIYDTPLAKGRPVARFNITQPGEFTVTHPIRPTNVYIVPDYITGNEGWINFLAIIQIVALILIIRDILGAVRDRKKTSKSNP